MTMILGKTNFALFYKLCISSVHVSKEHHFTRMNFPMSVNFDHTRVQSLAFQHDQLTFSYHNVLTNPIQIEFWTLDINKNEWFIQKAIKLGVFDVRLTICYILFINTAKFKETGTKIVENRNAKEALFHAAMCMNDNCSRNRCSENKNRIKHVNSCQKSLRQCQMCMEIKLLARTHYTICRSTVCKVNLYCFKDDC